MQFATADSCSTGYGLSFSNVNFSNCDGAGCTSIGLTATTSTVTPNLLLLNGSTSGGMLFTASRADLFDSSASGAVTYGIRAQNGSTINLDFCDFQIGGAPAANDIECLVGSTIGLDSGVTGGTNITVNTLTASGIIYDY